MDPNEDSQRDQSGQPSTSGLQHQYATQDGSLDMGCSDFELLKRVRHVEPAREGLLQVASSHSSSSAQPALLGACMPYLIPEVCYCCMLSLGLHQALLNERMAPEILHYKEELVERVKAGLKRQVRALLACASPACAAVVMSVSSTVAAAPIACVAVVFTSTCSKPAAAAVWHPLVYQVGM
jgi:hypothetical protein